MNKRKLIAALLASACITAGAFGIVGCEGCNDDTADTDNRDTHIVAVYNLYADNARANGDDVLSYDDWLATIKGENGKDGKDGKSAYEIAVANGFKGTEKEWLDSLKGANGSSSDGKSAYEIAVENGFKGTEEEWLASLKGQQGAQGPAGSQGNKGEDGVGIVSVEQVTDKWGICSYFVFTLSDGNTIDTSATPMINIDRNKQYIVASQEEKQQLIGYGVDEYQIKVMPITDITADNQIYYINSGDYREQLSVKLIIKGSREDTPLRYLIEMGAKVDFSDFNADKAGEYTVSGEFMGFKFSFKVTVKEDSRTVNEIEGDVMRVDLEEISKDPDFIYNNMCVTVIYSDGSTRYMNVRELGAKINPVEINSVGIYDINGEYNGLNFVIKVFVFDYNSQERTELGIVFEQKYTYGLGITADDILNDVYASIIYSNGDQNRVPLRELGATLDGVDLTTAGEKSITFNYKETEYQFNFEIRAVEFLGTLTGTDNFSMLAYAGQNITEIKLYSNDKAQLTVNGESNPIECDYEMLEEGSFIYIWNNNFDIVLRINIIDETTAEFATITEEDMDMIYKFFNVGNYEGTVNEKTVTLKLYSDSDCVDGIVFYTVDNYTYVLWYNNADSKEVDLPVIDAVNITIDGVGDFKINRDTNTVTPVEMP